MRRPVGYSFSAGPTMLPDEVLERIRDDLVDWRGTGFSVLELSQWDPALLAMFDRVEADLRDLLDVPDDYAVLFLHGGASNQFGMVPMNLLRGRDRADYLHTGLWSGKALIDARRYARINVAASGVAYGFRRVPSPDEITVDGRAAYVHYAPVETVHGVAFHQVPETGDVPLVADATSALFSMPVDIRRFGALYASTQKNLGVVGMTIVIIRRDLIGHADPRTPAAFDYAVHERTSSRFTTPPVFCWYVAGLMLDWIRRNGGTAAMIEAARRRADIVYAALDRSGFYSTPAETGSRAVTAIPFLPPEPALTGKFLIEAAANGLHALHGHSRLGGLRAAMYVGMPEAGARALAEFLLDFEARHG